MLASQRRSTIVSLVEETGAVKVSDLVDQLGVSDMTVRRDIEQLAREGMLERVHGGALAVGFRSSDEPGFTAKSSLMTRQKQAIAHAAATLVEPGAPGQTVVLTGGERTPSDALVGPVAVSALRTLHVDRLFLGVHGMDAEAGLTTPNLVEAETNRAMIAAARRVCVLADHTKWGVVGLSTIVPLGEVDLVITDDGMPQRARAALAESAHELIVAR